MLHLYPLKAFFRPLLIWGFFLLLWLTFVFQVTAAELMAGSAAAALATLGIELTLRSESLCFHPKLHWILQARHLPAAIAHDLWTMSLDLGRLCSRKPPQSELVSTTLIAAPEKCEAAAQRALAVFFTSMTPNSVVVDCDRESNLMLVHVLTPAPLPPLVRKLQE